MNRTQHERFATEALGVSPEIYAEMNSDPKPVGRPAEMEGGKRVNVYLDASTLERAAQLGDGNVSDGIRIALRQAKTGNLGTVPHQDQ